MKALLFALLLAINANAVTIIDQSWDSGEYGKIHLTVDLANTGVYDYTYSFTNPTTEFFISYQDNTRMPEIFNLTGKVGIGRIENLPPFGLWFLPYSDRISTISFSTLASPVTVELRENFTMNGLQTQNIIRAGIGPSNIPEPNVVILGFAGICLIYRRQRKS